MLAQLAARLRARQGDQGAGGGVVLGEDGEAVLLDDNCTVSSCDIQTTSFSYEDSYDMLQVM